MQKKSGGPEENILRFLVNAASEKGKALPKNGFAAFREASGVKAKGKGKRLFHEDP